MTISRNLKSLIALSVEQETPPTLSEVNMKKYKGTVIKKRSDGRYYARYKLSNGVYKDIYGATQDACYKKLKAFTDNLTTAQPHPCKEKQRAQSVTFKEFFDTWIKQEKAPNCRPGTIKNFHYCHKHLATLDPKPLNKITADEIRQILLATPSPEVRDKCYKLLAMIFRAALQYDIVTVNVMEKVSRFKAPKANSREPLTADEEKRFWEAAKDSPCAVIFALMLFEGLRTSEAKAVCPCDIKDEYIVVDKSIDDAGKFCPTKTGNARHVPIFAQFKPFADKYRGKSKQPVLGKVNKHTAVKEYSAICKATGITKAMYSLRHTFATRCEELGISMKQTALWLGHSSTATTARHYIGITDDFERQNAAKKSKCDTNLTQI